jgi:hypothetical protein
LSQPKIQPRTLKGFRDYLPEAMLPRERIMETARRVFRSYGFSPIDTPALEYAEILLGKGGDESDKLVYRAAYTQTYARPSFRELIAVTTYDEVKLLQGSAFKAPSP